MILNLPAKRLKYSLKLNDRTLITRTRALKSSKKRIEISKGTSSGRNRSSSKSKKYSRCNWRRSRKERKQASLARTVRWTLTHCETPIIIRSPHLVLWVRAVKKLTLRKSRWLIRTYFRSWTARHPMRPCSKWLRPSSRPSKMSPGAPFLSQIATCKHMYSRTWANIKGSSKPSKWVTATTSSMRSSQMQRSTASRISPRSKEQPSRYSLKGWSTYPSFTSNCSCSLFRWSQRCQPSSSQLHRTKARQWSTPKLAELVVATPRQRCKPPRAYWDRLVKSAWIVERLRHGPPMGPTARVGGTLIWGFGIITTLLSVRLSHVWPECECRSSPTKSSKSTKTRWKIERSTSSMALYSIALLSR